MQTFKFIATIKHSVYKQPSILVTYLQLPHMSDLFLLLLNKQFANQKMLSICVKPTHVYNPKENKLKNMNVTGDGSVETVQSHLTASGHYRVTKRQIRLQMSPVMFSSRK